MSANRYTLDELCSLVGLPKRTIRFYMQEGLVERPEGQKRGSYYLDTHVQQLQQIQAWQKAGYSLERIRQLLEDGATPGETLAPLRAQRGDVQVWSRIHIAPGVELSIEPQQAGLNPDEIRALYRNIANIIDQLKEGDD
ncbi:MAG: MerR family transcriptional regulator [Haliea sp.]|nr:MerR family transcriptional regulator [Haliea sp.]